MQDYETFWKTLAGLSRKELDTLAREEILDVRGLSKIRNILYKYNLSSVTFDHKLRMTFKKKMKYGPKEDLIRERAAK